MPVNLDVFNNTKSIRDYQRAEEEFQLNKQLALQKAQGSGSSPAAVQIANEIQKARANGDTQRINDLLMSAKMLDRGIIQDAQGNPIEMAGYGQALGSIAGVKKAMETQGQKNVEAVMNPIIAGGEAGARQAQELTYAGPIAGAKATATSEADQIAALQKKAVSANTQSDLLKRAKGILETGKPTGSLGGAGLSAGKRALGISDDTTRANTALNQLAADLTASVPRMEGPQSDADRAYYKEMAGNVGNTLLPVEDRLAAIAEIEKTVAKYKNIPTPVNNMLGAAQENIPNGQSLFERGQADFKASKPKPRLKFNPVTGRVE